MESAPFFAEVADGPDGGAAWWLTASDGVRVRMGAWMPEDARGTVLFFPGRTEYVEKYGRAAADMAARGYASVAVDWRGQGLADRPLPDRSSGHVNDFTEYQLDVHAVLAAADALSLPKPFHLAGHSMGGAIGLRAVVEGAPFETAAFSAPMWGIIIKPFMRPFARAVTGAAGNFGFGHKYAPGTEAQTYVLAEPFEGNKLTRDRDMYDYMQRQLRAHPELALGGPSLTWVHEALKELRALRAMPLPKIPGYCAVGGAERIVDANEMRAVMARWQGGVFETYPGSEHEILMETPEIRARFFDAITAMFDNGHAWDAQVSTAC